MPLVPRILFGLALLAGAAFAQTRSVTWDSSAVQLRSFSCSPNGDGTWSCTVCARVPASVDLATCETFDVKGTTNVNRLNALGDALELRWLGNQAFGIDGGSP